MMKRFLVFLLLPLASGMAVSCSVGESDSVVNIIFDTDMGNDIDDALALDMLYKYMDAGKVNLLAIPVNKEGLAAPEFIDVMGTWYGYPDIPVGIIRDGADCGADSTSYTRRVLDMKVEDGSPLFARSHGSYGDYPESVDLYRKVLSEAQDGSVTIVSVGFSTNLARLLDSQADEYSPLSGRELVDRKVKMLYTMAGNMADTTFTEYNVVIDIPSAQKVFAEWPTPVVTSPFELGAQIKYPATSIENDFGWADSHPVVEAYRSYMQMPYDRETWDLTAVMAAVEGGPEYFTVSPQGSITVTDAGATLFREGTGDRAYLSVTPEQAENIRAHLVSTITLPPKHRNP